VIVGPSRLGPIKDLGFEDRTTLALPGPHWRSSSLSWGCVITPGRRARPVQIGAGSVPEIEPLVRRFGSARRLDTMPALCATAACGPSGPQLRELAREADNAGCCFKEKLGSALELSQHCDVLARPMASAIRRPIYLACAKRNSPRQPTRLRRVADGSASLALVE